MLATIHDDTWNALSEQHIIPNSKRWDYSDILSGGHKQIKGPAHMAEGGHHLEKPPTPTQRSAMKRNDTKHLTKSPRRVHSSWPMTQSVGQHTDMTYMHQAS